MIPSRPLSAGEILIETFRIYRRTFVHSMLLQCIFIVPCVLLIILGMTNVVNSIGDVFTTQHSVSDAQVTSARNRVLLAMERNDPGSLERMRKVFHESSVSWDAPLTRDTLSLSSGPAVSNGVPNSATDQQAKQTILSLISSASFVNGWIWLLLGCVLFSLAANAPVAGATDLASREFEERPTRMSLIWGPMLKRNLWMVLAFQMAIGILAFAASILRLPFMFSTGTAGVFIMLLVVMLTTVGLLYFILRFALVIPAIISEELNLIEGFKRSWNLTRDHVWRVLGVMLAFGLIACVVGFIVLMIVLTIIAPQFIELARYVLFAQSVSIVPIMRDLSSLIWTGGLAYLIPIIFFSSMTAVFTTVLYYDLRTRHDGPLSYEEEATPLTPIFGSIETA